MKRHGIYFKYSIFSVRKKVLVYGVQASGTASMYNSIEHRKIEQLSSVHTIADGIAVKEPGEHTFNLCKKYIDEIVTVTDDEISTAILTLIEQKKLIAEGGNVISIHHERASETVDINGCYLRIVMETRNYEHIDKIRSALVEAGYNIS